MLEKRAVTAEKIADVLGLRWSGRAFDPDRSVARPALTAMLEAARWAPSCFGDEPWRFICWDRFDDPAHWAKAFACLSAGNQSWAKDAPLLLAALADSEFARDGKPNRWGQYDTGAAAMSLALQATALDLMVHQMGGFDAAKLQDDFGIPVRYRPMAMICIGYQLSPAKIGEDLRDREFALRRRSPLSERFFQATWGNGYVP